MDRDSRFYRWNTKGKFGLSEWYADALQAGFSWYAEGQKLRIPSNLHITRQAALEARARQPHMFNKYNDNVLEQFRKILDGFIIEHHLKHEFKRRFPFHYRPPENECRYDKYSLDDWLLDINGVMLQFDAKKTGHDNRAWVEEFKARVMRIFILGSISNENCIVVDGFTTSKQLAECGDKSRKKFYRLPENELIPARLLIAYINHVIDPDVGSVAFGIPQVMKQLGNIPYTESLNCTQS
jgi:hypothetical protein